MSGVMSSTCFPRVPLNDIEKDTVINENVTMDVGDNSAEAEEALGLTQTGPKLVIEDHAGTRSPISVGDTLKSCLDNTNMFTQHVTEMNGVVTPGKENIEGLPEENHDDDLLVFESLPSTPAGTSPIQPRISPLSSSTHRSGSDVSSDEDLNEQNKVQVLIGILLW